MAGVGLDPLVTDDEGGNQRRRDAKGRSDQVAIVEAVDGSGSQSRVRRRGMQMQVLDIVAGAGSSNAG